LKTAYTLIAPIYDAAVATATGTMRRRSLEQLAGLSPGEVLLSGIGTGLDLPWLPSIHRYTGIDLTPAMLERARRRARDAGVAIRLEVGDAMALPYAGDSFDCVVMHLILAVVPAPERALAESARVLRPGGRILLLDKFLRAGQRAWLRRAISPLAGRVATRTDVVFEQVLAGCPGLEVESDEPVLAGGWFRQIRLRKPGN